MSKVEELAKKYCEGSSFEDACMEKPAYIAGYHQAEKDLKDAIAAKIRNKVDSYRGDGIVCISVLKQHCEDFIDSLYTLEMKEVQEEPYITKKVGECTTTTKIIKKGEKV